MSPPTPWISQISRWCEKSKECFKVSSSYSNPLCCVVLRWKLEEFSQTATTTSFSHFHHLIYSESSMHSMSHDDWREKGGKMYFLLSTFFSSNHQWYLHNLIKISLTRFGWKREEKSQSLVSGKVSCEGVKRLNLIFSKPLLEKKLTTHRICQMKINLEMVSHPSWVWWKKIVVIYHYYLTFRLSLERVAL